MVGLRLSFENSGLGLDRKIWESTRLWFLYQLSSSLICM